MSKSPVQKIKDSYLLIQGTFQGDIGRKMDPLVTIVIKVRFIYGKTVDKNSGLLDSDYR